MRYIKSYEEEFPKLFEQDTEYVDLESDNYSLNWGTTYQTRGCFNITDKSSGKISHLSTGSEGMEEYEKIEKFHKFGHITFDTYIEQNYLF